MSTARVVREENKDERTCVEEEEVTGRVVRGGGGRDQRRGGKGRERELRG